jgi:hypothetical protein
MPAGNDGEQASKNISEDSAEGNDDSGNSSVLKREDSGLVLLLRPRRNDNAFFWHSSAELIKTEVSQ